MLAEFLRRGGSMTSTITMNNIVALRKASAAPGKETGERKFIGYCLKALNVFNNIRLGVDYWDLICAPNTKIIHQDMIQSNSYSTYRYIHTSDRRVRRSGQCKFTTKALEEGLQWAFDTLKNKNTSPFELSEEQ
eukprot:8490346-Ditylum_brightwellii.AAC.1